MIVIEFSDNEAHAAADAMKDLAEGRQASPGATGREAIRTADKKIINAVEVHDFYQDMAKVEETP